MRAAVLQHIWCESPGYYGELLEERGHEIDVYELDEGSPLPDLDGLDLVLVLGGPMSVNDEEGHSFLAPEERWIAEAIGGSIPYFGVCLGAQLLAATLSADVFQGQTPEVGVMAVSATPNGQKDGVLGVLGSDSLVLQWHGDTFDLPEGASLLASSALYPNQAFRWGDTAYGLQFHLEVTGEMIGHWAEIPEYRDSLTQTMGPMGFDLLADDFRRHESTLKASAVAVFSAFLDEVASR